MVYLCMLRRHAESCVYRVVRHDLEITIFRSRIVGLGTCLQGIRHGRIGPKS